MLRGDASRIGGEMGESSGHCKRQRAEAKRAQMWRCGHVYLGNAAMTYAHQRKYTVSLCRARAGTIGLGIGKIQTGALSRHVTCMDGLITVLDRAKCATLSHGYRAAAGDGKEQN